MKKPKPQPTNATLASIKADLALQCEYLKPLVGFILKKQNELKEKYPGYRFWINGDVENGDIVVSIKMELDPLFEF